MPDQPPQEQNGSANIAVLLAVILLVAATVFLLLKLKQGEATENCLAQGRHNCEPIDVSGSQ